MRRGRAAVDRYAMSLPRVLIVDDDADVRAALGGLLRARGFAVEVARDGLEAIDVLERGEPPSAVVADLLMPGLVGNELIEYLASRDDLVRVPLAIVTGSARHAPGGIPLFHKPVDADALVAFLRAAITRAS